MRFAAIDVGSNTLRLLIADTSDNSISRIYKDRAITRLAEGIKETGAIRQENMEKSVAILKNFSRSVANYQVMKMKAVGTSALRDSKNSRVFINRAFQETGVEVDIITGIREAELTLKGILLGVKERDGSLIIDIGGGSTEWIAHQEGGSKAPLCGSLPVGVVNLSERFIKTDPPSPDDIVSLNREIDLQLIPLTQVLVEQAFPARDLVGSGGTITTLASMDRQLSEYAPEKVHLHKIPLERLCGLRDVLVSLPLDKRRRVRGLEPERADLIIPGILLTIKLMEFLGFREVTVSDYGLLEGIIKEMDAENGV